MIEPIYSDLIQASYGAYAGYGGNYANSQLPTSVPQSTAYGAYPPAYPAQVHSSFGFLVVLICLSLVTMVFRLLLLFDCFKNFFCLFLYLLFLILIGSFFFH